MKAVLSFLLVVSASYQVVAGGVGFAGLHARDLTPLAAENVRMDDDGGELVINRESAASLKIVYQDDERASLAAGYLAMALEDMFGVEFERYLLPDGVSNSFERCFYIPHPDDGDRFAVEVGDRGVNFIGRSDFAVYDFCERVLGVRHYWDGEGGCSVPKREALVVPSLGYSDAPLFSLRRYSARGNPNWLRVAKGGGTFDRWARCHTTDDGFCYGSPEGFDEYCRRVDADIAGGDRFARVVDRKRKTVSVSPWDVLYDCRCKWCRTMKRHFGNVTGDASTVMWERFLPRFVKYMEVHHPDYRISVLPYWNYVMPPCSGTDIGTNVQAEVCSMSGLAAFKWDRVREREEGIILDWERVTGRKVANWHYSCWPAEYTGAAYVYGKTVSAHYRRMREHIVGSFICGGKDDFPRFSITMYVWMRCLWNPDVDVDAIYDEFCRRQFGPAAKPMREVIRIQEEAWDPKVLQFPNSAAVEIARLLTESATLVRGTSSVSAFMYYVSGFSDMYEQ